MLRSEADWSSGGSNRSATEVQGPLLLLMAVAFLVAIPRGAPAWAVAVATFAGLPLAHLIGRTSGDAGSASWGMLIALAPVTIAAYVGAAIGTAIRSAETLVDRRLLFGAVLIGCSVVGAGPVYATLVARGQPFPWWVTMLWQLVTLVVWAIATPVVLRVWRSVHAEDAGTVRPGQLATHALTVVAIATIHAILLPLATRVLLIPLGTASVAAAIGWAFAAYLPLDLLAYIAVCGAAYASDADRRARGAGMREAAARGELAVARLAGLRAQLRPHFLFNALNTASVLAARGDADGTRRVLAGLGDLLRYVMRDADRPDVPDGMVPLKDEIAFIQQYLSLERERLPDRLRTMVDVSPDVHDVEVPALVLQPLVENAIIHGVGGRIGAGEVVVRVRRDDDTLRLSVEDDGPGPVARPNGPTAGIGLANTRARLAVLYGSAASLSLEPRAGGGTLALLTLPLRSR